MIYPANFEQKIGFDRIRAQVAELCTTVGAREMVRTEGFTRSEAELSRRLGLADELRVMLVADGGFAGGEFVDIGDVVAKARIEGAFLEVEEIRLLHRALVAVGAVLNYVSARDPKQFPLLGGLGRGVGSFPAIVAKIDSLIDRFGKIRDNASPELADIRRTIRAREADVGRKMQKILAAAQSAGIVDADASLSVRDGRTVIPVAAGNKKKLPGFIHDESGSGKTFYIEPVEIVEINNELRELEYAERREIVRILSAFTEGLRPDLDGISAAGDYLVEVDFVRAKARWAVANGAVKPIISNDGRLVLRLARHPLLAQTLAREAATAAASRVNSSKSQPDGDPDRGSGYEAKEIVPLDVALSPSQRIIVISGPNAGGKSVCLKTVALLQYMFQCGFLVPALENSEMPVFGSMFIDIGDEQSIDNDLSTYSSHLLNMKQIIGNADGRSIVFIDEFGSGTEPVMGGAIAESVLEKVLARGAYGVITTHYSNIKYFASNHEGVVNGAMAFDVAAIRPLFRLIQGEPGSSFAIEIARKIGLPEEIIRSASEKAGTEHVSLERQLREIARDRRYWETKRDKIRVADRRVEELESDYAARLAAIKAERGEILKAARAEAKNLVVEANKLIESTIKTIRESQAEKELTRLARKEVDDFRESLDFAAGGAFGGSKAAFGGKLRGSGAPVIGGVSGGMAAGTNAQEGGLEAGLMAFTGIFGAADPERESRFDAEMERILRRQQNREKRKTEKAATPVVEPKQPVVKRITVGSKVRIKGQATLGEVTDVKGSRRIGDAEIATVAFGQILSSVAVERLEIISAGEYKAATRPTAPRTKISGEISDRKLQFAPRLDVRGLRPTEALAEVEIFIDNALMIGVNEVSILHGKGTGALKTEIRRYLKGIPAVSGAVDDHADRGGAGITLVTFRQ